MSTYTANRGSLFASSKRRLTFQPGNISNVRTDMAVPSWLAQVHRMYSSAALRRAGSVTEAGMPSVQPPTHEPLICRPAVVGSGAMPYLMSGAYLSSVCSPER